MVPEDGDTDATWQLAASEFMMNACIGDDYVAGAFTIEGANLVVETFPECAFP